MRCSLALVVLLGGCASSATGSGRLYDGEPIATYVRRLHDLNPPTSEGAVHPLSAFGLEALPYIEEGLRNDAGHVRANSAFALYDLAHDHPLDRGVVQLLLHCLEDTNRDVRWWAVGALGEMRPTPPEAVPALQGMVEDPDAKVRESVRKKLDDLRGPEAH